MCFGTYIRSLSDLLRTQPLKNKTKIKCEHTRAKRASENEVNNGENKRCMKHGESGERGGGCSGKMREQYVSMVTPLKVTEMPGHPA